MVCTRRNEAWNTSDRREGDGFSGSMRFECTPVINVRKHYPLLYYSAMIRLERDLSLAYSLKKEKETQEHCFVRKVPLFSRERRNQRNQNASDKNSLHLFPSSFSSYVVPRKSDKTTCSSLSNAKSLLNRSSNVRRTKEYKLRVILETRKKSSATLWLFVPLVQTGRPIGGRCETSLVIRGGGEPAISRFQRLGPDPLSLFLCLSLAIRRRRMAGNRDKIIARFELAARNASRRAAEERTERRRERERERVARVSERKEGKRERQKEKAMEKRSRGIKEL